MRKSEKKGRKKHHLHAVSFSCSAAGVETWAQTHTHKHSPSTHTLCQSASAHHGVCVSRDDRCHTASMQTGIRRALDRPPPLVLSSPLIAATPICLMSGKACLRGHEIRARTHARTYSRCTPCDTWRRTHTRMHGFHSVFLQGCSSSPFRSNHSRK